MIAIVNVDDKPRIHGEHTYELRINERVICTFKHNREEPLHECLFKAALAAEVNPVQNRRKDDIPDRKSIELFEKMAKAQASCVHCFIDCKWQSLRIGD